MPVMNAANQNLTQPRSVPVQMSMSKITSNVGSSSANAYKSVASNAPSFTSAVAPKRSFNFGNTRAVQANMSSLSAQASVRSGNVVMKAHPDSFMPEFSVKGSGAISLQKNYQDNDFGAGRMKTVVKMGGGDGKFTVTLKTPEGRVRRKSSAQVTNTSSMPLRSKEWIFHTLAELDLAALAPARWFLELLKTRTKASWMMIS